MLTPAVEGSVDRDDYVAQSTSSDSSPRSQEVPVEAKRDKARGLAGLTCFIYCCFIFRFLLHWLISPHSLCLSVSLCFLLRFFPECVFETRMSFTP